MKLLRLLLVLIFTSQAFLSIATPTFKIGPSPSWKSKVKFNSNVKNLENEGSISYLLLDWQDNEITKEYNYRYCIRLNNEDGVQSNSQLEFTFDPSYQELVINKIVVHRNGKIINKLDRSKVELMRNEKKADRYLYDGSYSAVTILEDIRVGDILEYEYTFKGANPIFKDYAYSVVSQAYNVEIQHLYYEMLLPRDKKVKIKNLFGGTNPKLRSTKQVKRLVWDLQNVAPIFTDDDTPSWHNAYPRSEVSSFKNWNEVRSFMLELYPMNIDCPKIDEFVKNRNFESNEEGIIGTIRFVQDEIRYLAMSNGVNSHKPHQPEAVFSQRFGDCKDKSYLLSLMLNRIGVSAWPALVSTKHKRFVDQYSASPFAFNHVIVKFIWKDKEYWVDPTSNYEKGGLNQIQNPMFGKALVIDNDTEILEDIPEDQVKRAVITEDFWYTDSISKVRYEVQSKFYGELANLKRGINTGVPLAENMDGYLDYCNQYYNAMSWQTDTALTYTDDQEKNSFRIDEKYYIEDIWEHRGKDTVELYSSYYPFNLYEFLNSSDDKLRTMPLKINSYPVDVELNINLHFPKHKGVGFTEETDSVVNDVLKFYYKVSVNKKANMLTISYRYKSLKDHVPIEDLKGYFKDYERISDKCEYPIEWGIDADTEFKLFGPALFITVLLLICLFFVFKKLYLWNDKPEIRYPQVRETIGGWLGLVALGLYMTPISIVYLIYDSGYFNQATWDQFIELYNNMPFLSGGFYFFELIYNIATILAAIFLIVLMHQKRTIFPKLYIYFRVAVLAGLIIDTLLGAEILGADTIDYNDLTRSVVGAAIWIPYMMKSQRVKETFVRTRKRNNSSKNLNLEVATERV